MPWLLVALAAVGFAAPAHASLYRATTPVAVSGDSPFTDCTADHDPENPVILGHEAEPFLAVNPLDPDHIVGSWIQDHWVNEGNGRGFGVGTSFDGGESWQTTLLPGLSLCTGGELPYNSDPWLDFGADGSLFHIGLPWNGPVGPGNPRVVAVNTSRDGGLSWSDPITLSDDRPGGWWEDKGSISADPFDPNDVYATWTDFYREPVWGGVVRLSRSTDGGVSWEEPRTTYDSRDFGLFGDAGALRILVLPDGTLVNVGAFIAGAVKNSSLFAQRSTDGGLTWTPRDATALGVSLNRTRAKLNTPDLGTVTDVWASFGVDRDTGDLYAVWRDDRDEGVSKAHFSMSTDAGATWSEPIRVGDTPAGNGLRSQSFLATVAVTGDGTVGVLFYDWRFDDTEPGTLTDVWLAHCHARSADCSERSSWHADARLTESSFDLEEMPASPSRRSSYFPGDYMGLTATEHDFLAFYVQPHDGDPASVFFSRIEPVESRCVGDCDDDTEVTVDEVLTLVNIALGEDEPASCDPGDTNGDEQITVDEILAAVNAALTGCVAPSAEPPFVAAIDSLLAPYDTPRSPGVAVLVARHGDVVFARGYGYTDSAGSEPLGRTTPFRVASVSKQFTAMAIMILAERGLLEYDDPALHYLPEIERFGADITIRHLLTHTSGLPNYYKEVRRRIGHVPSVDDDSLYTNVDAAAIYLDWGELLFAPGDKYTYSNQAYELLALVIERVSEQTYGEFLRENVFEPAGMTTAVVRDRPEVVIPHRAIGYRRLADQVWLRREDHHLNWIVGAGCVYASLNDLLAWDRALAADTLVSAETMAEAWTPMRLNDGSLSEYGFGWHVSEEGRIVHHGGWWLGFRTYIARNLDTGLTAIALSNASAWDEVLAVVDTVMPFCGNRVVSEGEECDAGNLVSGEGCESDCTLSAATGP